MEEDWIRKSVLFTLCADARYELRNQLYLQSAQDEDAGGTGDTVCPLWM